MSSVAPRPGLRPPTRPAWHGPPDALRTVWTQPRATVRWILDHGDLRLSILLVAGASAVAVIADGSFIAPVPALGPWTVLASLMIGFTIALIAWAFGALVLTWFGRVLGGGGKWRELLVAAGWGQAPAAAGMPFALLKLWSHSLDRPDSELLSAFCLWALWLWSLLITTLAVAEAHRFSFARAVIAMFATIGLYALLLAVLSAVFGPAFMV